MAKNTEERTHEAKHLQKFVKAVIYSWDFGKIFGITLKS